MLAPALPFYRQQSAMTRATIIGGGLAGATAASVLGTRALLLEREEGPHDKICGEFLSHETSHTLGAIGFDVGRLGGAPISHVRLHHGHRSAAAALPWVATGITRRTLDAALLEHAARRGAEIQRGIHVRRLTASTAVTSKGESPAATLLLASGKHDVHGIGRNPAGTINKLVGFKMFFRADSAMLERLRGHVDVTLFDGGYAGLQPVEGGRINLCLLIERERFKMLGGDWPSLFNSLLREPSFAALSDAEQLLEKPLTISGVPYGFLAQPTAQDKVWRLGDQAAVIPSFCGDGMAIALHSGHLAATMLAAGASVSAYQARLKQNTARQVRLATNLQRVATTRLGRFALMSGLSAMPSAMAQLARWTRVENAKG